MQKAQSRSSSRTAGLVVPLALAVSLLLVSTSSATAAVTRIRVDWTSENPPGAAYVPGGDQAPSINVFEGGGPAAQYSGVPCAQEASNCGANEGFRWVEENRNGNGYAQKISFVDDRPQQRRQLCFEVHHPYEPANPANPRFTVTVAVTDPDGTSRTRTLTLTKGQGTELDCSPVYRPPTGLGDRARAPAWWRQGRKVLKARGGRCRRTVTRLPGRHPVTGRDAGTYTETSVTCRYPVPRRPFARWGGPVEICSTVVSSGNPEGDSYAHFCSIFSSQGKRNRPTRSSWRCLRFKSSGGGGIEGAWIAQRSPRSSQYRGGTLARCLSRRPGR